MSNFNLSESERIQQSTIYGLLRECLNDKGIFIELLSSAYNCVYYITDNPLIVEAWRKRVTTVAQAVANDYDWDWEEFCKLYNVPIVPDYIKQKLGGSGMQFVDKSKCYFAAGELKSGEVFMQVNECKPCFVLDQETLIHYVHQDALNTAKNSVWFVYLSNGKIDYINANTKIVLLSNATLTYE